MLLFPSSFYFCPSKVWFSNRRARWRKQMGSQQSQTGFSAALASFPGMHHHHPHPATAHHHAQQLQQHVVAAAAAHHAHATNHWMTNPLVTHSSQSIAPSSTDGYHWASATGLSGSVSSGQLTNSTSVNSSTGDASSTFMDGNDVSSAALTSQWYPPPFN